MRVLMRDRYTIEVELAANKPELMVTPAKIAVPENSYIDWLLHTRGFRGFERGLIFTVYFEFETPFSWKTESTRVYGFSPLLMFRKDSIVIASGCASKKGENFKYGVKVTKQGESDPIYEDDPFITVF